MRQTYGKLLPGMKLSDLAGKLIVVEGTDGAGRSTQINMLRPWLEELGHAVLDTGMTRSLLAGEGIRRAKEGNNLGRVTQSLFYATDFVDRLENEMIPALRAGFIVLTDRYIYSLMARAIVRGMDAGWIRGIYSAALVPDAVFYLRLDVEQLSSTLRLWTHPRMPSSSSRSFRPRSSGSWIETPRRHLSQRFTTKLRLQPGLMEDTPSHFRARPLRSKAIGRFIRLPRTSSGKTAEIFPNTRRLAA